MDKHLNSSAEELNLNFILQEVYEYENTSAVELLNLYTSRCKSKTMSVLGS